MVKCWVKKKMPSQGYSNISAHVWKTVLMLSAGWFHFRNGQQNDSSRQSQKADLNLSAHFSNIVYDQMSCMLVRHLFIYRRFSSFSDPYGTVFHMNVSKLSPQQDFIYTCHQIFLIQLHCCVFILPVRIKVRPGIISDFCK